MRHTDIEIIIKGGEELSEFYPKNYEKFEKKIGESIVEMFPGVGCWFISSELTDRHKAEEKEREQKRKEQFKQTLISVLEKHPELLKPVIDGTPDITDPIIT